MNNLFLAINHILDNKLRFLVAFFCVFTTSYGVLYALDIYPEPVSTTAVVSAASTTPRVTPVVPQTDTVASNTPEINATNATTTEQMLAVGDDTLPNTLTIDALDRTVTVLNPASNSVAALDAALLKGVIRHPDSATFKQEGNMFILGHSSYLPTVLNRNFQALNGIQNLKWGDTIKLSSKDTLYTYKVEKVYKAKASAVTVPVSGKGKTLTLATCNSFGSKDDRYIVEAILIKTTAL